MLTEPKVGAPEIGLQGGEVWAPRSGETPGLVQVQTPGQTPRRHHEEMVLEAVEVSVWKSSMEKNLGTSK